MISRLDNARHGSMIGRRDGENGGSSGSVESIISLACRHLKREYFHLFYPIKKRSPESMAMHLVKRASVMLNFNCLSESIRGAIMGNKRKWYSILLVGLVLILAGSVMACAKQSPAPVPTSPTPASTPVSEASIPAHYTTYMDKAGLFSISYPPNWELGLSEIKGITQDLNDYWKGVKPERTVQESTVIFFVGVQYETGYNPNVSIIVIPSDEGNWKLEDLVEAVVQEGLTKDTLEYQEFSRDKSIVDGKEAIFLEYEAEFPFLVDGKFHALDVYMRDDRMIIKVACGVMPPKDFNDFKTDLYTIVRSLRILK